MASVSSAPDSGCDEVTYDVDLPRLRAGGAPMGAGVATSSTWGSGGRAGSAAAAGGSYGRAFVGAPSARQTDQATTTPGRSAPDSGPNCVRASVKLKSTIR